MKLMAMIVRLQWMMSLMSTNRVKKLFKHSELATFKNFSFPFNYNSVRSEITDFQVRHVCIIMENVHFYNSSCRIYNNNINLVSSLGTLYYYKYFKYCSIDLTVLSIIYILLQFRLVLTYNISAFLLQKKNIHFYGEKTNEN